MKWYKFYQNNSGGSYVVNDAVSHCVYIQAEAAAKANEIARQIGIYFSGFNDCECCGPRWRPVNEDDARDIGEGFNPVGEDSWRAYSIDGSRFNSLTDRRR